MKGLAPYALRLTLYAVGLTLSLTDVRAQTPAVDGELQKDVIAKLAGAKEIRPGVMLADRSTIENRQEARTFLEQTLKSIGLEPKRQAYGTAGGENVYALLSSGRPSADVIVLGAHYDSVTRAPGANDDATGVAAVMAIAKSLAKTKPLTRDLYMCFFDQEERGLVGSRAFAQMLKDENKNVVGVHTIDQVGWDSNKNRAIELELPYDGAFALYEEAVKALKVDVPLLTTAETGSDHSSFRRMGFPAMGITEEYRHGDTTPHYHKPTDTFDTVDFDYLASTTKVVTEVIRRLITTK